MFGVKREGGGFEKLVWEHVLDTLPGGLVLDLTGFTPVEGNVPAGTLVGRDPATGLGKIVVVTPGDPVAQPPTETTFSIKPLGYTVRTVKAEDNCLSEVGISGTIREKALPYDADSAEGRAAALPRITHV